MTGRARTVAARAWRFTRGTVVAVRWMLASAVVLVVVPAVMEVVQTYRWPARWRRLIDAATGWRVQVGSWVWFGAVHYLGDGTAAAVLAGPAAVLMSCGVGRVVYPHTPRGRARARYPADGWATWPELRRGVSAHAARQVAVRTRPTIEAAVRVPAIGRPSHAALALTVPATEVGTWAGTVACGPPFPVPCYVPHEAAAAVIAPPRSLKTALMGHHIVDHPGPVLCTDIRGGTWKLTHKLRARRARSRRVHLLDPEGLTGAPSTFRWDPTTGCADPTTAMARASALTTAAGEPGEDGAWFAERAAAILRVLLLTAAVSGRGMSDVAGWASGLGALERAVEVMREHRDRIPAGWVETMSGILTQDGGRTRAAVMMCLSGAVEFMSEPEVADLCRPLAPGEPTFDVESFISNWETVYLVASDRPYAKVAPLLAAFTEYVIDAAKKVAAATDGGRLDPPMLLSLDEVANTIPMPLDRWIAFLGGFGFHVWWSAQSKSQLRQRWGRDGADTVWNATTVKLIAGGLTVQEDLDEVSRLSGTREDVIGGRVVDVPVLTPDQVRTLPRWHAALIHATTRMALVRIRPVWARADVLLSLALPTPTPQPVPPITATPGGGATVTALPTARHDNDNDDREEAA